MTNSIKQVVIHCKPIVIHFPNTVDVKNHLNDLGLEYNLIDNELDVIVDDVPYQVIDGYYQDPDVQFCEHYGFNYDLVNCIEAM